MYYCVYCKRKTETNNVTISVTPNNKSLMRGVCVICNHVKTSFVSNKQGHGFTDKIPVELHLHSERGEEVPGGSFNDQPKYSYCGPGTKYTQRNNEGYKGINKLDQKCKLHDQFYSEYSDTKLRNMSDVALAKVAKELARDPSLSDIERSDADLVSNLLNVKAIVGLGLKKASQKWNEELAHELHKPKRVNFERSKVIVTEIDDVWGADLVEMQK